MKLNIVWHLLWKVHYIIIKLTYNKLIIINFSTFLDDFWI